jgi:hypothetical protein
MINDIISVTGLVEILLYNNKGILKDHRTIKNMVVTSGKSLIASRLVSNYAGVPGYMWVGTSSTAAAQGQTDLITPVSSGRTYLGGTALNANVITYSATFIAGVGTGALREAGVFNSNTGGIMLCRTVFDQVSKNADDILTINWNLTIN